MTEAAAEARCSMRWRFVSSPPCTNSDYHRTQKGICVRDDRFIVLSNDWERIYRIFDTHENTILRKYRARQIANKIAVAASRYYSRTGKVPRWPWEPAT